MKNSILLFLFLAPTFLFAQYPNTGNKARLGYQTTGDGLIWRGVAADTVLKPRVIAHAYFQLDTVNAVLRRYIATRGSWQLVGASETDSTIYATRYWTSANFFPLEGGTLTGTGGDGFIGFPSQVSAPGTPASGLNIYAQGSSFNWKGTDGFERQFASTLTGGRTYTLPNTSGTFALGTGTANLVPLWATTNTLGSSNIQDNGTAVSILNSKPFMLGQWTTAGRPTGVTGYIGDNSTLDWIERYSATAGAWISPLQSSLTGGKGTAGSMLFLDANGRSTQNNAQLFWNNSSTRLGINTASPSFTLDVNGNGRMGSMSFETNGFAGSTGIGLSATSSARTLTFISQGGINANNSSAFNFTPYAGGMSLTSGGANRTMSLVDLQGTIASPNFLGTVFGTLRVRPTYNFTTLSASPPQVEANGVLYDPTLTSMYVTAHNFLKATSGNIVFATGGSGALGMGTSTPNGSSVVDFNSTSKGSLLTRMNTTQRNAMVSSVLSGTVTNPGSGYTTQPTATITGGGGTGAIAFANFNAGTGQITSISILNQGENYTSAPTLTITGGGGAGGAGTLTLAPIPESLLFYNTDSTGFEYRGNASNYLQIATKQYARSLVSGLPTTWLKPSLEAGDVTINGASSSDFRVQNTRVQFDGKFKVGADSSFSHDPATDITAAVGTLYVGRAQYGRIAVEGTDVSYPAGVGLYQTISGNTLKHGWEIDNLSIVGGTAYTNVNFIEYNGTNHFGQALSLDLSGSYGRLTTRFGRIYATNQYAARAIFINSDTISSRANDPLFTINNVQNGDQLNIYKNRSIRFNAYGQNAKSATALGKTETNQNAIFATDGTIVEREQKRDTTIYIVDADYNFSTALTTAQVASRYNRVIFLMTTTAAAGSNSDLTLHTPDANLMQVEYLIRSTDETGGFTNVIQFGTNNAVASDNALASTYTPSPGQGVGIRAGLRSGVYKYFYY